jgi:hypothetical protein
MTDQGSGRTWRLVNDARPGDIYVVPHAMDACQVEEFLSRQGRAAKELRLVNLEAKDAYRRMYGIAHDRRVYIDHRCVDLAKFNPLLRRSLEEVEDFAIARFDGAHHYPVDVPCDTPASSLPYSAERKRGGGI